MDKAQKTTWTFLTNHGRVLLQVAKNPQCTTRQIAVEVGVTERSVQKIIADLEGDGYLTRHKEGRGNRYVVHPRQSMRHAMERDFTVGDLLVALGWKPRGVAPRPGDRTGEEAAVPTASIGRPDPP